MFRMCGTIITETRHIREYTVSDIDYTKSRTEMVLDSLAIICHKFDLAIPIWLDYNIRDFQLHDKTRFNHDNFIESIDFDYLEIHVLEE